MCGFKVLHSESEKELQAPTTNCYDNEQLVLEGIYGGFFTNTDCPYHSITQPPDWTPTTQSPFLATALYHEIVFLPLWKKALCDPLKTLSSFKTVGKFPIQVGLRELLIYAGLLSLSSMACRLGQFRSL